MNFFFVILHNNKKVSCFYDCLYGGRGYIRATNNKTATRTEIYVKGRVCKLGGKNSCSRNVSYTNAAGRNHARYFVRSMPSALHCDELQKCITQFYVLCVETGINNEKLLLFDNFERNSMLSARYYRLMQRNCYYTSYLSVIELIIVIDLIAE